jgi:hypothetical protein
MSASHGWLEDIRSRYIPPVFVDEATDFSAVQLGCMAELAHPSLRSWFACGDFMQRITQHGVAHRPAGPEAKASLGGAQSGDRGLPRGAGGRDEREVRVFDVRFIKGLEFEAVFFVAVDRLEKSLGPLFGHLFYVRATRVGTYLGQEIGVVSIHTLVFQQTSRLRSKPLNERKRLCVLKNPGLQQVVRPTTLSGYLLS